MKVLYACSFCFLLSPVPAFCQNSPYPEPFWGLNWGDDFIQVVEKVCEMTGEDQVVSSRGFADHRQIAFTVDCSDIRSSASNALLDIYASLRDEGEKQFRTAQNLVFLASSSPLFHYISLEGLEFSGVPYELRINFASSTSCTAEKLLEEGVQGVLLQEIPVTVKSDGYMREICTREAEPLMARNRKILSDSEDRVQAAVQMVEQQSRQMNIEGQFAQQYEEGLQGQMVQLEEELDRQLEASIENCIARIRDEHRYDGMVLIDSPGLLNFFLFPMDRQEYLDHRQQIRAHFRQSFESDPLYGEFPLVLEGTLINEVLGIKRHASVTDRDVLAEVYRNFLERDSAFSEKPYVHGLSQRMEPSLMNLAITFYPVDGGVVFLAPPEQYRCSPESFSQVEMDLDINEAVLGLFQ